MKFHLLAERAVFVILGSANDVAGDCRRATTTLPVAALLLKTKASAEKADTAKTIKKARNLEAEIILSGLVVVVLELSK